MNFLQPLSCFRAIALSCLVTTQAVAHIGSPNVAFDGQAGPNPVRVVIRPPAALPGAAQVSVRSEGASGVSLQATLGPAGGTAPPPVRASAVAGAPGLFQAELWLLDPRPLTVRVLVEHSRGSGTAAIPLDPAATQRPTMSAETGAGLLLLGLALLFGAVAIVGAAAREASLPPHTAATPADRKRGRLATILAFFILGTGIAAGSWRWRTLDREFRHNALARPQPVRASVLENGAFDLLRLEPAPDQSLPGWNTLSADHGKLMHLFLVREPAADVFAHLHPVRRNARTFETLLPPLAAGDYRVYGDISFEDGRSETLVARVAIPNSRGTPPQPGPPGDAWCKSPLALAPDAPAPVAMDRDDAWWDEAKSPPGRVSALAGGGQMVFQNPGRIVANRDTSLRFVVIDPQGEAVPLYLYMGMLGHCVVRRNDGEVFTHLHPNGTISMALQEKQSLREGASEVSPSPSSGRDVIFPYAFPRGGDYRLWVQVCTQGRIETGVFDVQVDAEP